LGSEGSEVEFVVDGMDLWTGEETATLVFSSRISLLYVKTRERREALTFDWKIQFPPAFPHASDLP